MKLRELGELGVRYIRRFCNYLRRATRRSLDYPINNPRSKQGKTNLLRYIVPSSLELLLKDHNLRLNQKSFTGDFIRFVACLDWIICYSRNRLYDPLSIS